MAPLAAMILSALILFCQLWTANAWHLPFPMVTPAPHLLQQRATGIERRDIVQTEVSTCGYLYGDPKLSRVANPGYNCRVDTLNGLWGFCPTTVIAASDCGLAGNCIDSYSCSNGCGSPNTKLTTFTCKTKQYCSFALLTVGVDQTYSYIACGGIAKTEHFLPSPTAQITPTTKTNDLKVSVTATLSTPTQTGPTQTGSAQTGSTQPPSTSTPGSTTSSATQSFRASIETDSSPAKTTSGNNGGSAVNSGTNNSTGQNDSSPNNVGAIIGGVIGGIALSCIFGIAAIYLLRRNRSNRSNRSRSPQISTPLESNVPLETKDQRYNQRYTGGWMPREMEGSQYERRPNIAVELPG